VKALKAALFVLLAVNTLYFAVAETASKAIDSAAWLTLLVLFTAETSFVAGMNRPLSRTAVRAVRLAAAAGVLMATVAYLFEENVLDAVNATLWIIIVVLLEIELRWPAVVAVWPRLFKALAGATFGGLALLVVIWVSRGMWFDGYDAALWLLAFGLIEVDVTKRYASTLQAIAD
jgi:hypothetical protein